MEQVQANTQADSGPSVVWIIFKIAVVILIVFVGIKFFSEKNKVSEEKGFDERKTTKPKTRKNKKNE